MRIRALTVAVIVFALSMGVVSAQASSRNKPKTTTYKISPATHTAVVKAVMRFVIAWNGADATGVCAAVSPTMQQAFITTINRVTVDNGSALPLVTTCVEAIRTSDFIPRYFSPSKIRAITRTVSRYPAVQTNNNTVTLEGTYMVVRIHGHWLLNKFSSI